jgi:hypothetical protein
MENKNNDLDYLYSQQVDFETKLKDKLREEEERIEKYEIQGQIKFNNNDKSDIEQEEIYEDTINYAHLKPNEIVFDFTLPLEIRLKTLTDYKDDNELFEAITRLFNMYCFSYSSIIYEYLYEICMTSKINSSLRLYLAVTMYSLDTKHVNLIDKVLDSYNDSENTPCKVEGINILFKEKHENGLKYITKIVEDQKIDCGYRYSILLQLKIDIEIISKLITNFFNNKDNKIKQRILAGQFLMQYLPKNNKIEEILLEIGDDTKNESNIRADAYDVVSTMSKDRQNKEYALTQILKLGQTTSTQTIYTNNQNVHFKKIIESSNEIIEYLMKQEYKNDITLDKCKKEILKKNSKKEIKTALERIEQDRAIYCNQYNLSHILCRLVLYIKRDIHKEELWKRLVEELEEMADTCSSGYITRLTNVISGFNNDITLKIDWRDQIASNLSAKLNKLIQEVKDDNQREKIIIELSTIDKYDRPNFLSFFRYNLPYIQEELRKDFSKYIDYAHFDLYMKEAVCLYDQ